MTGRRTRRSIQLRSPSKRARSESLSKESNVKKVKTREEIREYEKIKKRNQREKKRGTAGPAKRGPKIKVNIKEMSENERKEYNREKKRLSRVKRAITTDDIQESTDEEEENCAENSSAEPDTDMDIDFDMVANRAEGATILRLVNSPSKKRYMPRQIVREVRKCLLKLQNDEIYDVVVSLGHLLPQSVKDAAVGLGVKVNKFPKSSKRSSFSDISTSTKHRYKEELLRIMGQYNDATCAHAFVTLVVKTTELSQSLIENFSVNGIEITPSNVPSSMRMTHGINKVAKVLCSPENLEFRSDSAKMQLMLNVVKEANMSIDNYGDAASLASTFSISDKFARRILRKVKEGKTDELFGRSKKRGLLDDSNWPELISQFCLAKPIAREAPGETVSVKYGVRAEKYIRQFSIEEIFKLFCLKYKDFTHQLSSFRKYVPKNLVSPSLRDVKRNVCPLHENLKRSIAALNRFFITNKVRDLMIPSSTIDISLLGICKPSAGTDARNPLHWNMNCTKGVCKQCGFDSWFRQLQTSINEKDLTGKFITYSQWVTEYEETNTPGATTVTEETSTASILTTPTTKTTVAAATTSTAPATAPKVTTETTTATTTPATPPPTTTTTNKPKPKKKSKVVLRKYSVKIEDFLVDVFRKSISTESFSFPEHLRKAWRQWELSKKPLVIGGEDGDVAIRTREDYQQDLKFLCLSETVSTHRGVGVITMVCYPVVLEIFHANKDEKELHGVIYMSDTKNKNFDTVFKLENKLLDYVEDLGYCVKRYDRLTDGCGSQFWCWGTMKHLEDMKTRVPLINFHRYERYEGKNMSDALGSMIKRRSNDSALRKRIHNITEEEGLDEIMADIESGADGEELVFENHYDSFCWLKSMMEKSGDDKFSESFDKIELVWLPDEDIEKNLLTENNVRKIPKVKSYNCVTSSFGKKGVSIRDSSCNCECCQKGDVFACVDSVNCGVYSDQVITKDTKSSTRSKKRPTIEMDFATDEESEPEVAFDDDSESSDSEDSDLDEIDACEEISTIPLNPGMYLLYQYAETKYYVGCIIATLPQIRQVRFLRKFNVRGSTVTFTWPEEADEPLIEVNQLMEKCRPLPDPILLHRGNIRYPAYVFNDISLQLVY